MVHDGKGVRKCHHGKCNSWLSTFITFLGQPWILSIALMTWCPAPIALLASAKQCKIWYIHDVLEYPSLLRKPRQIFIPFALSERILDLACKTNLLQFLVQENLYLMVLQLRPVKLCYLYLTMVPKRPAQEMQLGNGRSKLSFCRMCSVRVKTLIVVIWYDLSTPSSYRLQNIAVSSL